MSKLIKFIRENNNWEEIMKENGIKIKKELPLILFQYDMIECKFNQDWMMECRGNILNIETMQYVCRSFNKFFNYGEGKAEKFEYTGKVICMEKVDGSIVKYYYDSIQGKFRWATNGMIDANKAQISNSELSFGDIIRLAQNKNNMPEVNWLDLDKNYTYVFELTSQYTQVVVPHSKPDLTLLAIIENKNGEEKVPYSDEYNVLARYLGVRLPIQYRFNTMEDLIQNSKQLPALEEGYVVADFSDTKNVKRVKCKGAAYVALHHVGTNLGLNDENLFVVAKTGEIDEFSVYFPALKNRLETINADYDYISEQLMFEFGQLVQAISVLEPKTRKEEALIIQKFTCPSVMFNLYDKKFTVQEYIKNMNGKDFIKMRNYFKR